MLAEVLTGAMKLLHPFMPFITEEIFQCLPHEGDTIMLAEWPRCDSAKVDDGAEKLMQSIMETIGAIRNMRAEVNAVPSKKVPAILLADAALMEGIKANAAYIHLLGGVDDLQLLPLTAEKPANAMTTVVTGIEVYLPLAGLIDVAKETARLTKEVADLDKELARVNGKLNNKGFLAKAPGDVVEKEKAKAAEFEAKKKSIVERLEYLKGL